MTGPKGTLFVVSSPSGGGKGSILSQVLAKDRQLAYSVSATTRSPHENEVEGKEYYFVDAETFGRWIEEDRFVEWAVVHDNRYGTLKDQLEEKLAGGQDVVLELDVQGAESLRAFRSDAVLIFIMPPSLEVLEQRLRRRDRDDESALNLRLKNAQREMEQRDKFDYVIVNDSLDEAVNRFETIVETTRKAR